jgi:hypothetical protein
MHGFEKRINGIFSREELQIIYFIEWFAVECTSS